MKVKNTEYHWIYYFILFLSFANDSFRLTSSGITSLYRLLSPLLICCLLVKNFKWYLNAVTFFISLTVYSLFVSILYYHKIQYEYYFFAIYIFGEYIIIKHLKNIDGKRFNRNFYYFLDKVGIVIIMLGFLQCIFRFKFPFIHIAAENGTNLFFSNENELSAPLSALGIIYLFVFYYLKRKRDGLKLICIVLILFINDAKLSIIGISVAILFMFFNFLFSKKIISKSLSTKQRFYIAFIIIALVVSFLSLSNIKIKFRDYSININSLIINSWHAIIQKKPFVQGGSITDRTDAIIYGLIELEKSRFLGIGLGSSVYMLTFPQYTLQTAKSMHNILAQFFCEFGIVSIGIYIYILKQLYKCLSKANYSWINSLKVIYAISFIFISSQSSIGILSNYMLWAITMYIIFINDENDKQLKKPILFDGIS